MSGESPLNQPPSSPRFRLLEGITAAVLLLVVAVLGWMLVAANKPEWAEEVQVVAVLVLLTAALVLVSVVALMHTR